jgi:hypothetical protein
VLENRGMEKILASEWAGHMMKLRKLTWRKFAGCIHKIIKL